MIIFMNIPKQNLISIFGFVTVEEIDKEAFLALNEESMRTFVKPAGPRVKLAGKITELKV